MIPALARFVDALRAEGLVVSPAEVIDAARALDLVGPERRETVRTSLRVTLAKDRQARAAFDRLFDRFFAPPRPRGKGAGEGRPGGAGATPRGRGAGSPRSASVKPQPREDDDRPRRRNAIVGDGGRASSPRPTTIRSRRDGRLRRVLSDAQSRDDRLDPARRVLARRMTTDEERAIAREVPRLVAALELRTGRRLREARSGRPWLRQALRDSLATGGVPFAIPQRAPRPRATRVVLLVDVSFSVARASGFFLLMASSFLDLGRRARVLAFVDRPVDVTAAIARWARGNPRRSETDTPGRSPRRGEPRPGRGISRDGVSFADVLDGIEGLNLDAPSDYGRALHALLRPRSRPRGRDTVLVVVGDARTNRFDPLPFALEEIARGCRSVLWLVPEPASRWGTADSALPAYRPWIDVLAETTDLAGIARALAELRRRL